MVDDGSDDKSALICDIYASSDSRIRAFHKDNEGVSSARNYGLEYAKGEWIWFVDSDDYILNGAKDVLSKALQPDCQAISYNY